MNKNSYFLHLPGPVRLLANTHHAIVEYGLTTALNHPAPLSLGYSYRDHLLLSV